MALALVVSATACGGGGNADPGSGGSESSTGGSGQGGSGAMGGSPNAGSGGTSGTTATPCVEDDECESTAVCYTATCEQGICVSQAAERGSDCASGFCNGVAFPTQCLPCIDDSAGSELDTGCSSDAPMCDESAGECVACRQDSECNDRIPCTDDRCVDSACENSPLPAGSECGAGVCDGNASSFSCVPCIDDADLGLDAGCSSELPVCDTTQVPATCIECGSTADCDDDNECTNETCLAGVCEYSTVLGGTPCAGGYCDGVSGMESCVVVACEVDTDCEDDVDCTSEVCGDDQTCVYSTDHDQCPDSGDACRPNHCTVSAGCQEADVTETVELLSNGNFDAGAVDWTMTSVNYDQVIFSDDYIPRLTAHTAPNVLWLGGGESEANEENSASQQVSVPNGTVSLELSFAYTIHGEDLPDNHNSLVIYLRGTESSQPDVEILTFFNQDKPLEDETLPWTWDTYTTTIDASEWVDSDAILELAGTGIDGYTHFFFDTMSLAATVCE